MIDLNLSIEKSREIIFLVKKKITKDVPDSVIIAFQIMTYILFSRVLRYYFRADRRVSRSIHRLEKGSLLVSNHQSVLDPFIILAHLPFKSFMQITPIRFPTSHYYYVRLRFLAFWGAYNIGKGKKDLMLGLFRTRQYLISGRSVMIFPEGKICNHDAILEFQKGIEFLTGVAANVVFIKMDGFHRNKWLKVRNINRQLVFSEVETFDGRQLDVNLLRECMKNISVL